MNTSPCTNIEPRLPDYLAGTLPDAERAEIHAHLDGCPACREMADTLQLVGGAMTQVPLRETLDAARREQIHEALRTRGTRPAPTRRWLDLLTWLNPARAPSPALRLAMSVITFVVLPLCLIALLAPSFRSVKSRADHEAGWANISAPTADPESTLSEASRRDSVVLDKKLEATRAAPASESVVNSVLWADESATEVPVAKELAVTESGERPAFRYSVSDGVALPQLASGRIESPAPAPAPAKPVPPPAPSEPAAAPADQGIRMQGLFAGRRVGGRVSEVDNAPASGKDLQAHDDYANEDLRRMLEVGVKSGSGAVRGDLRDELKPAKKPALGGDVWDYEDYDGDGDKRAAAGKHKDAVDRLKPTGEASARSLEAAWYGRVAPPAPAAPPAITVNGGTAIVLADGRATVAGEKPATRPARPEGNARLSLEKDGEGKLILKGLATASGTVVDEVAEVVTEKKEREGDELDRDFGIAEGYAYSLREGERRARLDANRGDTGDYVAMESSRRTVSDLAGRIARDIDETNQNRPLSELETRLAQTKIPLVDFREVALPDALRFIEKELAKAKPEGKPITIDTTAFKLEGGASKAAQRGDTAGAAPDVTLSLRDVSALNALKYLTEVSATKFRAEGDRVVITPEGVVNGAVATQIYPMPPAALDTIHEELSVASTPTGTNLESGVRQFFVSVGVPFPVGTSLKYEPQLGQLIVHNTPENLALLDRVYRQLDVATNTPPREPAGFNPYTDAKQDAFSTFAIDVDTASYTLTRQALGEGRMPDPEEVRTEEIVNAFDYDYAPPSAGSFALHTELAPSPFRAPLDLLKIGVQGKLIGRDAKRPAVLTLVIDGSGSMDTADRLGRIRRALHLLAGQLKPQDSIAIVQFSEQGRLLLDRTSGTNTAAVRAAVDALSASGSTDLEAGLRLGYEVAARGFRSGAANRVILLSDGVANLGAASAQAILATVEQYRRQGIYLTVLGFGRGNYDDAMLEQLANKGDGQYAFVDSDAEAQRLLVDQWEKTLHVIARDVKIQVEFNPERVVRWRQVGYENRKLRRQDFRNDAVDAGEVGSGQSVTALYDLELTGDAGQPIATVRVRYQDPDTRAVTELEQRVTVEDRHRTFAAAPVRYRVAACAAEFAERLRVSPYAVGTDWETLVATLRPAALELPLDQRVQELLRLAEAARGLAE